MDKVIIKDLLVRGILGINPDERVKKQDILVNVVMWADTRPAAVSDDITDAVNYKTISKQIIERVEGGSDFLVERLAADLADLILGNDPRVAKVMVRVEKPSALRFANSVGIEIERSREN